MCDQSHKAPGAKPTIERAVKTQMSKQKYRNPVQVTIMSKRHSKNDGGFSLVELTVIMAIIAVTAAFSVPALNRAMRDMQLTADGKSIATALTYAKLSAQSQMTHWRISFNTGTNQWTESRLNRTTGNFEVQGSATKLSLGVSGSGIQLKPSATSAPTGFPTASSPMITFNSRGIPIEGASIVYMANNNQSCAVSVSVSGKVQFWQKNNNQWVAR